MADQEQFQGLVRRGEITYFPVVPGRIEFAIRLRRFLLKERPQVVAVELPSMLESAYEKAIAFLPKMSVILVPGADDDEELPHRPEVRPGLGRRAEDAAGPAGLPDRKGAEEEAPAHPGRRPYRLFRTVRQLGRGVAGLLGRTEEGKCQ